MGLMLRYPVVEHRKKTKPFCGWRREDLLFKDIFRVFIGALSELIRDNDITA